MSKPDHAAREHATWSASASEGNWACAGRLALTMDLPEDTNPAADWGTVCHEISETCLREGREAVEFSGEMRKGKKFEFEVDDEMVETAQHYVDYVRKRVVEAAPPKVNPASLLKIEQKFSLADLDPPFDAGGTADAVIWNPTTLDLEVIDLKTGRGVVVEAKGNKQGRTYALGAMLANPQWKARTITVTIVQARAPHKDGRIRSETFSTADLVEWTAELIAAMKRSRAALDEKTTMPDAAWSAKHLTAGQHCEKTFCKAAGFCPAYERKALDEAGVWLDDLDQPRMSNTPDSLSTEALAQKLDMLDMIEAWCNAVRRYAHTQAESGIQIPGYQLVEKIGNRAWKADVTPEQVAQMLAAAGKDPDAAYQPPKPSSPAQVEKAGGVKIKSAIADLVERPVRGTNLVAADKTTRPAVQSSAEKFLQPLDAGMFG